MNEFSAQQHMRLDACIAAEIASLSRNDVQKHIKNGCVLVNGSSITKPAHKVEEGDSISVDVQESQASSSLGSKDLELEVLYEDDACLVIHKPAGIAVHPASSIPEDEPTILHGVLYLLEQAGLSPTPDAVLVHRLDRETTGCLLVAKTRTAYDALQKQFAERTVQKTYLALVYGIPNPPSAKIDMPIGRNLTNRTKMSTLRTSVSREAQTTYKTVSTGTTASVLECDLHTGRTHQIRVHLSSIGHPLLGDATYESKASKDRSAHAKIQTLSLHSWKLSFVSPHKNTPVHIEAVLPEAFKASAKSVGITDLEG